jgi:arabinose-5-phosphate isomerase
MAVGDCIANILMHKMGFDQKDYGENHPGGTIGKKLNFEIRDLLSDQIPHVSPSTSILETSLNISEGQKGIVAVVDEDNHLLGVVTDGDLRRELSKEIDVAQADVQRIMTSNPITINANLPAIEALKIMEQNDIGQLVVVDEEERYEGVVHMRDLVREGIE